ncbi:MAG: AmmeMemoRadiSam system radical SAM enzyme, partial [Deltaproteobacteria bacterium]|nr:AmmeMemoRadiSam system radical SAM enzyme [Deltaproteobacteria bacterium]
QSTLCASCDALLIERDWYQLGSFNLTHGRCNSCKTPLAGRFADDKGDWGPQRRPLKVT